ncbi:polymorphic toxin-type HINT domain-containing protein [Streptomyces californicus]
MAAKAAKYGEKIEKASDTVDRVETAVECSRLAADAVGNSFLAGTDVVMADGTRRPIEKVKAGDEVRATDPTTGRTSTQEVTATITGEGFKQLVRLALDTDGDRGDATEILTATAGHPFWVPSLKEWRTADELEPGQWLETGSGTRVQIEAVSAWTQRAAVYNLTVDTAHTYYVAAGSTPVLVHNSGRGRKPGQRPNYDAEGPHTTFVRHGGTGQIKKYAEWAPQSNPRNPAPFELVKRFDLEGPAHTNADGTRVDTPHINMPNGGDARAPEEWEKPLGCS